MILSKSFQYFKSFQYSLLRLYGDPTLIECMGTDTVTKKRRCFCTWSIFSCKHAGKLVLHVADLLQLGCSANASATTVHLPVSEYWHSTSPYLHHTSSGRNIVYFETSSWIECFIALRCSKLYRHPHRNMCRPRAYMLRRTTKKCTMYELQDAIHYT